jgi:hypothetical protein
MSELEDLLRELVEVIKKKNGLKGKLQRASVKIAFKAEGSEELTERLTRAARTLELALNAHCLLISFLFRCQSREGRFNADLRRGDSKTFPFKRLRLCQVPRSRPNVPHMKEILNHSTPPPPKATGFWFNLKEQEVIIETPWYGVGWLETKHTRYTKTGVDEKIWPGPECMDIETNWLPAIWSHLPASWQKEELMYGQ